MIEFKYFLIEQPIGQLYLGALSARDIDLIAASNTRTAYNQEGIQRKIIDSRKREIAEYARSEDAIFPTPIVLSASTEFIEFLPNSILNIDSESIISQNKYFSIIDGQHRLAGIKEAGLLDMFTLPVIIIMDTFVQQDAEIFVTINGNQRSVSKSLLYDLFGLSEKRSVEKVCHSIIKALNKDNDSKIMHKIKMLGYRDEESRYATVSQATMVDSLIKLITNNTKLDNQNLNNGQPLRKLDNVKYVFRKYFEEKNDAILYKILRNYFNAWSMAKDNNKRISEIHLEKSIGYMASFQLLRLIYLQGLLDHSATEEYYFEKLNLILSVFAKRNRRDKYSSSESGAKELFEDLLELAIDSNVFSDEFMDLYVKGGKIKELISKNQEEIISIL
jgi:DGQHR domain protein